VYPPPPQTCPTERPCALYLPRGLRTCPLNIIIEKSGRCSDVECGFMVCMTLRRSPRILIQKTDLRDFFRRINPATRKSSPNLLGAYMRRAGEPNSKPAQSTQMLRRMNRHSHSFLAAACLIFLPFGLSIGWWPPEVWASAPVSYQQALFPM
jgi:hypothetical protein